MSGIATVRLVPAAVPVLIGALRGWSGAVRHSLVLSIGDVAFGMEDGAVSIAGLVFGVAAGTNSTQLVLLAGGAGAAAGAVSMMVGIYLDATSVARRFEVQRAALRIRIDEDAARETRRLRASLVRRGISETTAAATTRAVEHDPEALFEIVTAFEIGTRGDTGAAPATHAAWMFVADLLAAAVPIVPFAIFDIATARLVSLAVTGTLLAALGMARARIGRTPLGRTVLETLGMATGAAVAGVAIGRVLGA